MRERLLIVDDEIGVVGLLKSFFEMSGYTVYTACNGKDALKQAGCQPDLVLLDINMPMPLKVPRQAFRGFAIRYLPLKVPRQAFRGFAIRYLPLKVPRQAFRGFAIPGKQAVASRPLAINR